MPYSARENDADVRGYVTRHGIATVLDIGAGSGTYATLLGDLCTLDAIEAWDPYVEQFDLPSKYRHVTVCDVRDRPDVGRYDLVILGDILEHMTPDEAAQVWAWAPTVADHGIISIPLDHWPQGAHDGNHLEAHHPDHLTGRHLLAGTLGTFDETWTYALTATFAKALP